MGTSLSGLTPATTFDGLLKTSDNEPIGAALKTISDGSGVDSVLQLSNSALQVNGAATINGAQMTIVGAGNDATTTALLVQNSDGIELLKLRNDRYAQLGTNTIGIHTLISNNANWLKGNSNYLQNASGNYYGNIGSSGIQIGNGATAAAAQLQVKGSGATSATTSLLVQNSAGANVIKANDDGRVLLGAGTTYQNHLLELNGEGLGSTQTLLRLQSSVNFNGAYTGIGFTNSTNGSSLSSEIRAYRESYGNALTFNFAGTEMLRATSEGNLGIGETTPTARLHIKGSGNDNTTTSLLVQNSDGNDMLKVADDRSIETYDATGNVIFKNNAGNRRFEINPDLTTLVDFQVGGGALSNLIRTDSGLNSVGIGTTGLANTRFFVTGGGATSATTALLVQNSAGTDLLKVLDDGQLTTKTINTSNSNIVAGSGTVYSKGFVAKSIFAFSNKKVFNVSETPTVGTSGDASVFTATLPYAPTSGNETLTILNASPTINQTGGANGITRGLYVNPTLTSAADFRAIETTAGNVVFGNLPTSATGLPTGAIYNDAGTLKIV